MNFIEHIYNATTISQRLTDGYINLNQMADATGKRIDKWIENQSTKALILEFETGDHTPNSGYDPAQTTWNSSEFTPETTPNSGEFIPALLTFEGRNGGTWAHPDIAIQFAQWCSPTFALQVSRWVRQWLTGETSRHSIMSGNELALEEIDAEIARLKSNIKRDTARLEKKAREKNRILEAIAHQQMSLALETPDDEIIVREHTRRKKKPEDEE